MYVGWVGVKNTNVYIRNPIYTGAIRHVRTVEPVYKDNLKDQENAVSVDRWSLFRDVSVYLRLCIGEFNSGHFGQVVFV